MGKERSRLLVADDHSLVAAGIRELLGTRYDTVNAVADGQTLLAVAAKCRPDLILADISMPGLDGLEATRQLRECLPEVPVIILTMHDDAAHVRAAFEAGAMGYLVKSSAPRELFAAIDEVLAGRVYVTSASAAAAMAALRPPEYELSRKGLARNGSPGPSLTEREVEGHGPGGRRPGQCRDRRPSVHRAGDGTHPLPSRAQEARSAESSRARPLRPRSRMGGARSAGPVELALPSELTSGNRARVPPRPRGRRSRSTRRQIEARPPQAARRELPQPASRPVCFRTPRSLPAASPAFALRISTLATAASTPR